jgi:biotin synthase-related radical SAM superfamily protein
VAPEKVRVSIGTAAVLGLVNMRLSTPPTTAYVMTYTEGSCIANCSFCAQARENEAKRDLLSRVIWPDYPLEDVFEGFRDPKLDVLERICIQVINYPGFIEDTMYLTSVLKGTGLPLSLDICPVDEADLVKFKEAGIERISIPLDAATPEIFNKIKGRDVNGPYRWETHIETLKAAVNVFGMGNVGTNLIIGLGETEREAAELIQSNLEMGVRTILFAFTPLPHTRLEDLPQPEVDSYRRIQVVRHLMTKLLVSLKDIEFDDEGKISQINGVDLIKELKDGVAFRTTGCPGCNRPFYNERPSGPFYNYPRLLTEQEIERELFALDLH